MPPAHKKFVEWIEERSPKIPNLRESPEFDKTVAALRNFRDEHIKTVRIVKEITQSTKRDNTVNMGE